MARTKPKQQTGEIDIQWSIYDRIAPGTYAAYSRSVRIYRDPGYKRWTCLIRFEVLSSDLCTVLAKVPCWLNLGPGARPRAGRRTKYFNEWMRATPMSPSRQDRLAPRIFKGRIAEVEIGDTKGSSPVYSVVRRIVRWQTGPQPSYSVKNQPVKEGST
jgi:hypothetical protein